MELPGIRSARRMPRRTPCSSGSVWRRSTIRRGTSFLAVRPIRRRPWYSARKGAARRRLRLQAAAELESYNQANPHERVFVISYDDFNPYLDSCRAAMRAPNMDAGAGIVAASRPHGRHPLARRDEAGRPADVGKGRRSPSLASTSGAISCSWPRSTTPRQGEPIAGRWSRLRRRSGFRPLWTRRDLQIGFGTSLVVIALIALFPGLRGLSILPWLLVPMLAGWLYWGWRLARAEWFARDIRKGLRVLEPRSVGPALGAALVQADRTGRPAAADRLPRRRRRAIRALAQVQGVLHTLGYAGIVVLIDRVDEPQQVEGDPRKMRAFIWPLLDHKFLRHPGIGVKLLLPIELAYYLEKEDKEFYDRARPDKLNMIKPLRWTGPSLYDLASDRLRACRPDPSANGDGDPRLRRFIDDAISDDYLKDALGNLRTPRHLFKFLHRLIEEHCHRHTEDAPRWTVDYDTFRTTYAAYMRDLEAFDRGYGHG